jgi:hypothetical protein
MLLLKVSVASPLFGEPIHRCGVIRRVARETRIGVEAAVGV